MEGIEWLIFQIVVWILALLICFFIIFLIKYKKSESILHLFALLACRKKKKNKIENINKYKAKIYVRNSFQKITAFFSIFLFVIISFIVLNQYVNFVVVASDSMIPTFNKGDLVLVQSIDKTPARGDIIQFETPSRKLPVLHRVQEISNAGYVTKGDFSLTSDYWIVTDSQIKAKVISVFDSHVIIPQIGDLFICESRVSKFGSEFAFVSGLVNIFRILALIIFILAFLSLFETVIR